MATDQIKLTPERQALEWPAGPEVGWKAWSAPAALALALLLAAIGGILVDIPAALLGVRISGSTLPGGLVLTDTALQEIAFVTACVLLALAGGGGFAVWQLGLRAPALGLGRVIGAVLATYLAFFTFSVAWQVMLQVHEKERLLETLGAKNGPLLLTASALLTCILAPVCEEVLFRGYFFRALSNWRGPGLAAVLTGVVFGAVHVGSAPVLDLIPLGVLGLLLCLLYRHCASLYPCIAVHAINNSIAFGDLESWRWWQIAAMPASALALLWLLERLLRGNLLSWSAHPAAAGTGKALG